MYFRNLYGSSRIGVEDLSTTTVLGMQPLTAPTPNANAHYTNLIGDKAYELAYHLGNVLNVVKDRKLATSTNGTTVAYFQPDVVSYSDYYPFGQALPYRNGNTPEYRYGYQGSEKDVELKGEGNSYTTFHRMLDPRIGRWFSIDPVIQPWQSTYCSMDNNPIKNNDQKGDVVGIRGSKAEKKEFLNRINENSSTKFKINRKGELKIKLFSKVEGQFAQEMETAIKNPQKVYLNFVEDVEGCMIDSYINGNVDLRDMSKTTDPDAYRQNLVHFVVERLATPNYEGSRTRVTEAAFKNYHDKGLDAEVRLLKERFPNSDIEFIGEKSLGVVSSGSG